MALSQATVGPGGGQERRVQECRPRHTPEGVAQVKQHRRLPEAGIGLGAQPPAPLRIRPQETGRPRRAVAAQDVDGFQARAEPRATPRCPACAACAACSAGSGCSPPGRGPTGPTRPWFASAAARATKVSETLPSGSVRDHRGECPKRLAVSSPSCDSQVRAASRYVRPTIRSWVSTTASATNVSHSTAQTTRIARAAVVRELAEARRRSSAPPAGAAA